LITSHLAIPLRFFGSMCEAIRIVRSKDGESLADDSEKVPKQVLHLQLLRRALSAARGCRAIAIYQVRPRVLTTLKELITPKEAAQDEQDANGEEDVGKEDMIMLRISWLTVHAVLLSCTKYVFIPI
jgi:hypothetical protein